jgi:spermidine/putrescine transport system ATP-binding protein
VLLLDEPLGALDAKLRRTLQHELKALHREVGITFLYVTHDQEEALTMSDRLAVMREGEIEQLGVPTAVYTAPVSTYVAEFLGLANLLPVSVVEPDVVEFAGRRIAVTTDAASGACVVFARPERLRLVDVGDTGSAPGGHRDATDPAAGGTVLGGRVVDVVFVGSTTHVHVDVDGRTLQVVLTNDGAGWVPAPGTAVGVEVPRDALRLLTR